ISRYGSPAESSFLRRPTRSFSPSTAYGSCRTYAKRQERVSHRSLDGAGERAAHRLHRPSSLMLIENKTNRRTVNATCLNWLPIRRKRVASYGRYLTAIPDYGARLARAALCWFATTIGTRSPR